MEVTASVDKSLVGTPSFAALLYATVRAISDEVAVMLAGRIVEQVPKRKVFSPPHHEYTARLLASVPQMDPDWLGRVLQNS